MVPLRLANDLCQDFSGINNVLTDPDVSKTCLGPTKPGYIITSMGKTPPRHETMVHPTQNRCLYTLHIQLSATVSKSLNTEVLQRMKITIR